MSTRINTNVSSLNAHRNVVRNQEAQSKTLERLASGLKINQGADAPAQLQISEQLRAQSAFAHVGRTTSRTVRLCG